MVDLDWSFVRDRTQADARRPARARSPTSSGPRRCRPSSPTRAALAPLRIRSGGLGTVYLGFPDESFPLDHPQQWLGNYDVGAVAYDLFPPESPIRRLYEWGELTQFVAAIMGLDVIYPYADPLGALNLAVMGDGDELQWHFDQTDFVVSLALQRRRRGGDFEVSPFIRDRRGRALRRRCTCARRRALDDRHAADDARHAARVRGPPFAAPGRTDPGRNATTCRVCSATTRSPAR